MRVVRPRRSSVLSAGEIRCAAWRFPIAHGGRAETSILLDGRVTTVRLHILGPDGFGATKYKIGGAAYSGLYGQVMECLGSLTNTGSFVLALADLNGIKTNVCPPPIFLFSIFLQLIRLFSLPAVVNDGP